jgi:hypothetical protein
VFTVDATPACFINLYLPETDGNLFSVVRLAVPRPIAEVQLPAASSRGGLSYAKENGCMQVSIEFIAHIICTSYRSKQDWSCYIRVGERLEDGIGPETEEGWKTDRPEAIPQR